MCHPKEPAPNRDYEIVRTHVGWPGRFTAARFSLPTTDMRPTEGRGWREKVRERRKRRVWGGGRERLRTLSTRDPGDRHLSRADAQRTCPERDSQAREVAGAPLSERRVFSLSISCFLSLEWQMAKSNG